MVSLTALAAFSAVALGMVLTPGPNMAYLVSRSICQGRTAGMISLAGVALGFVTYMLLAAFGITALVFAIPYAYDALRLAGAAYLGWLAWNALKPGGRSPFQVHDLPPDSPRRLFAMGLLTNLGATQIAISVTVNALIVLGAGTVAAFLSGRPFWMAAQRWLMGTVLAVLAVRMAFDTGRR